MKIEKITLVNVMDLLHLFKAESDAGHRGVAFQNKANSYLFNVELVLEGVRLSALEVLPFKKFVSKIYYHKSYLKGGITYPQVPYDDIIDTFKKQESVNCLVINGAKDGLFCRPLYSIEIMVDARITGPSVLNILGVQPYASLPPNLLGLDSGEPLSKETFYKEFEEHLKNVINDKFDEYKKTFFEDDDHFTDAVVYKKFLQFAKNPTDTQEFSYNILNIRYPYGNIQFAASTPEELDQELIAYNTAKMSPDKFMRNLEPSFVFVIRSTFKTFLGFYMQTDWIKGYENLLLPGMRISTDLFIRGIEDSTASVLVDSMGETYGQTFKFLYNTYKETKPDWKNTILVQDNNASFSLEDIYSIIPANTLINYVIEVRESELTTYNLAKPGLDLINPNDLSKLTGFVNQLNNMINSR